MLLALPLVALDARPAEANPALLAAIRVAATNAARSFAQNSVKRVLQRQLRRSVSRLKNRQRRRRLYQLGRLRRMNRLRKQRLARREVAEARGQSHGRRGKRLRGPLSSTTGGFATSIVRPQDHAYDRSDRHHTGRLSYRRHFKKSRVVKLGRPSF